MAKQNNVSKAYDILRTYNGTNNQICYYKSLYDNGRLILEDFGVQYILANYNYDSIEVNKNIKIAKELGEVVKEKFSLDFIPSKIHITKIIGEMGGSYHGYVKSKSGTKLLYLKKKYILDKLVDIDYHSLDVDFDVYDNMPSANGRKLKEHQKTGAKFLIANKKCVLADSMGTGKMQDVDTITPTPNGYVRFGDLKIGDKIFGSDGKEHNIIGIFPHQCKDVYEIEFTDGSKTNSGLEHLWIVQDANNIRRKQGWQILSLQQILDRGIEWKNKNAHKYKFRIPICNPVEYSEKEYFIHPYILGMCLGNGNMCNNMVHISIPNHDIENVERITKLLNENYTLHGDFTTICPKYNIVKKNNGNGGNLYNTEIKRLGLNVHGNYKFIPEEYKLGSIEQRKELLYGLMDSDGYISKNRNKITYSTKSEHLAYDVVELVQSLGGLANVKSYDRSKDGKGINYSVKIQIKFCPFKLERKRERYTIGETHHKYLVKSIKNIKYLKTCNAMCIKVDSVDESYLTNNYIVTHNTTTSIIASLAGGYKNILVITTASLKTTWYKDLILYVPEDDINIVNGSKWDPGKKYTILNYDIIDNFYEVPMEPVYNIEYVYDANGNVADTLQIPVMIKDKKTGHLVQKMQKSRKKADIQKALGESPLFWENYDCVIIDEAQKLSNNGSIRYRTIYDFLRKSNPKAIFLLTGTPLTNRPNNLYNILKLIDADITRDYNYFVKRYCGGIELKLRDGRTIIKSGDATNLDELRERIKDVYIRRLASETGEMVEKSVLRKYYDLDEKEKAEYARLWNEYQEAQENVGKYDTEQYRQLVEGMLVRKYLAKEMTKHTIEFAEDYIENGEKVVIITCFQEEMDILQKHFGKKCVIYNGKMLPKQKDKAQDEFMNNPKVKVFIGQVIACGVGLSLPVARTLIFNSYDWVAANNKQAEDRIYRLTQTRDVKCIYQLFTDSISQDMFDKVIYKELIANQTIKSEKEKEAIK